MRLEGIPSDRLPSVLATGKSEVKFAFLSLSAREPDRRDAEYIEWHSLDHRPEQYRLPELRNSLRLVSTPSCRSARAASVDEFDSVDHVMTYLFTSAQAMPGFVALGAALHEGGRMPLRLPSVGYITASFAGKTSADEAVAGADVIPWRPTRGVYLIIEDGHASPVSLVDVPGVAGVWWYHGAAEEQYFSIDARGRQITFCYLDEDPVATARLLGKQMERRWGSGEIKGLLASPFYAIAPFDWGRHLP